MTDTSATLAALAELRKAATPGPWRIGDSDEYDWFVAQTGSAVADQIWARQPVEPLSTAAFIAAAGSFDFAALADELERLRRIEAAARELGRVGFVRGLRAALNAAPGEQESGE